MIKIYCYINQDLDILKFLTIFYMLKLQFQSTVCSWRRFMLWILRIYDQFLAQNSGRIARQFYTIKARDTSLIQSRTWSRNVITDKSLFPVEVYVDGLLARLCKIVIKFIHYGLFIICSHSQWEIILQVFKCQALFHWKRKSKLIVLHLSCCLKINRNISMYRNMLSLKIRKKV